jgi:uncharacterized protein with PIN domain
MDAETIAREREKQQLLNRLAEIMVLEQREQGVYARVPHYGVLELASHRLGQELSRTAQRRAAAEAATANVDATVCPTCGRQCPIKLKQRVVQSIDGPVDVVEPSADCRPCRRSFFPSA